MKLTFTMLFFAVIIAGCQKSDLNPNNTTANLQGTYIAGNIATVQMPVMYVQGRQITDTAIINSYLRSYTGYNGYNMLNYYTYSTTETISAPISKVVFVNNDSINITFQRFPGSFIGWARKTNLSQTELSLKLYDSTVFYSNGSPPPMYRCDSLSDFIVTKSPFEFYYKLYGFSYEKIFFTTINLINDNGQLYLPLLVKTTDANLGPNLGACRITSKHDIAIKADNIENKINAHDTVVIQEKRILLIKQ